MLCLAELYEKSYNDFSFWYYKYNVVRLTKGGGCDIISYENTNGIFVFALKFRRIYTKTNIVDWETITNFVTDAFVGCVCPASAVICAARDSGVERIWC